MSRLFYFYLFFCHPEQSEGSIFIAGFRPRATSDFGFGQSQQSHVMRVRGKTGSWSTAPNQDGSETRSEVQSHLSTQTILAKKVGFEAVAQPRPTQGCAKTKGLNENGEGTAYPCLFHVEQREKSRSLPARKAGP